MEKDSNLLTNRRVNGVLAKITDLILVNIMFLLTCIPVITIADATASMYHMMYHLHEGKDDRTISEYFSFFGKNFVKSLPVEIAFAVMAGVQVLAYSAVRDGYGNSVLSILFLIDVAVVSVYSWLVVLFARYENPFAKHLDNAWRLALAELPFTLLCVVLRVLPLILTGAAGGSLSGSTLFWFVIGFAFIAYLCSGWYLKIFAKRIPQ
ncbi:MAG: DUF624 domain-containing protein [Bulleidia sp.]